MRRFLWLALAGIALGGCTRRTSEPRPTPPTPGPTATVAPETAPAPMPTPPTGPAPSPNCGMSPSDWCPAPAGDPCGANHDTASCKADARCEGMTYRGESVVPCMMGDRCFPKNCPTVGCISRCETLSQADCTSAANSARCAFGGSACSRRVPCRPMP